jgi:hypothetical protein
LRLDLPLARPLQSLAGMLMRWKTREPPKPAWPLSLVDRPQRLGFLPTWSFWKDQDVSYVQIPIWAAALPLMVLAVIFGGSGVAVAMVPGTVMVIGLGLLERHIRREVVRRQRAVTEPLPALRDSAE